MHKNLFTFSALAPEKRFFMLFLFAVVVFWDATAMGPGLGLLEELEDTTSSASSAEPTTSSDVSPADSLSSLS